MTRPALAEGLAGMACFTGCCAVALVLASGLLLATAR